MIILKKKRMIAILDPQGAYPIRVGRELKEGDIIPQMDKFITDMEAENQGIKIEIEITTYYKKKS